MARRRQERRDTAALWTSNNPVLAAGEIGHETDTGNWKVGDGSTAWTSLYYQGLPVLTSASTDLNALLPVLSRAACYALDAASAYTNVPADFTVADGVSGLTTTRCGASIIVQQLFQYRAGVTGKTWSRAYDGSAWTTWITEGHFSAGEIVVADLADNAVETAKIKDANVTTAKILDNNVTLAKLATQAARTILLNATNAAAVPTALALTAGQLAMCNAAGTALIASKLIADNFDSATNIPLSAIENMTDGTVIGQPDGGGTVAPVAMTAAQLRAVYAKNFTPSLAAAWTIAAAGTAYSANISSVFGNIGEVTALGILVTTGVNSGSKIRFSGTGTVLVIALPFITGAQYYGTSAFTAVGSAVFVAGAGDDIVFCASNIATGTYYLVAMRLT